ncbi:MAG: hypothetical protein HOL01_15470 [Planctomycetaceae bacterium]|nr:hypothetical protein [Planctomycetaceae bacterium]MBT6485132.1 hypothetical protein [Planctomycetaceae bacterium]MBT6495945.1 hypothetical protein [Planctomycetaceae bacterium]
MSDEQVENVEDELKISDEYEEICSDEVDRVVETLEQLAEGVASENIRTMLEEASQSVYELIYDGEEEAEAGDSEEPVATDEPQAEEDEGWVAEAA